MGVKGTRKNISTSKRYSEPDLLVGVDDIIKKAKEEGLYSGDILKIEDLIPQLDNIQIEYKSMDPSLSGSLDFQDGKWVMCINKNHNIKRQRFTIAHELGHFMLHKNKNVDPAALIELLWKNEVSDLLIEKGLPNNIIHKNKSFLYELCVNEYSLKDLKDNVRLKLKTRTNWRDHKPLLLNVG